MGPVGRPYQVMTPALIAEARRLRNEEHLGTAAIAERLGVRKEQVSVYAPDPGRHTRHVDTALELAVIARVKDHQTQATIARELSTTPARVSRIYRMAIAEGRLDGEAPKPTTNGRVKSEDWKVALDIQLASLRTRLLRVIAEKGPFADVNALVTAVKAEPNGANNFEGHEVQHLVQSSLGGRGLVTFRVRRRGKQKTLLNITITKAGLAEIAAKAPVLEVASAEAEAPPTIDEVAAFGEAFEAMGHTEPAAEAELDTIPEDDREAAELVAQTIRDAGQPSLQERLGIEPEPAGEKWPLLNALRSRVERGRRRADLLRQAAELADDGSEAADLRAYADMAVSDYLTDLEREYLGFAEAAQ